MDFDPLGTKSVASGSTSSSSVSLHQCSVVSDPVKMAEAECAEIFTNKPQYPISTWNAYDRVLNGWNNHFQSLLGLANPPLHKFFDTLVKKQRFIQGQIQLALAGRGKTMSAGAQKRQKALKTKAEEFDQN